MDRCLPYFLEHPCDKMQSFLFVMVNLYIASVSLDDVFGYGMLIVFFGYIMDKLLDILSIIMLLTYSFHLIGRCILFLSSYGRFYRMYKHVFFFK